jgi:hypothetical protein
MLCNKSYKQDFGDECGEGCALNALLRVSIMRHLQAPQKYPMQ